MNNYAHTCICYGEAQTLCEAFEFKIASVLRNADASAEYLLREHLKYVCINCTFGMRRTSLASENHNLQWEEDFTLKGHA